MQIDTILHRQTIIVGGNSVNIYSPFQSFAPGMYNLSWTAERGNKPKT